MTFNGKTSVHIIIAMLLLKKFEQIDLTDLDIDRQCTGSLSSSLFVVSKRSVIAISYCLEMTKLIYQ